MNDVPPRSDDRRIPFAIAVGLTIATTVAIYWPALGVGFLGDDFMILHRLRGLGDAADVLRFFRGEFFEYYRPLAFVSHAIDWARAGQDARTPVRADAAGPSHLLHERLAQQELSRHAIQDIEEAVAIGLEQ